LVPDCGCPEFKFPQVEPFVHRESSGNHVKGLCPVFQKQNNKIKIKNAARKRHANNQRILHKGNQLVLQPNYNKPPISRCRITRNTRSRFLKNYYYAISPIFCRKCRP
jgi:hypothetical protein